MKLVVRIDELRRRDARQLPERFVEPLLGDTGVERSQGLSQPAFENDLLVGRALGRRLAGSNLGPVHDAIAQLAEPLESRVFDDRLGESPAHSFPRFFPPVGAGF